MSTYLASVQHAIHTVRVPQLHPQHLKHATTSTRHKIHVHHVTSAHHATHTDIVLQPPPQHLKHATTSARHKIHVQPCN